MLFKDRFIELQEAHQARQEGKYLNSTPLLTLPSLGNFLGNIPKGICIGLTADANVGKTPLVKNFVYSFYRAKKENPLIEYKILYFALEERANKFIDRAILHFYKEKFKTQLSYAKLQSNDKYCFTESEWLDIKSLEPMVDEFMATITLYEDLYDPDKIYQQCIEELLKLGKLKTTDAGTHFDIKSFVPNNPYLHVVVIVDHVNDLTTDKIGRGETHTAMDRWCKIYSARNLSKKANCTVFQVIQQALDKTQYTNKGSRIVAKLEPSKEGLGDNKQVYRSLDVLLGLFAPSFFDLDSYNNYDLNILKHNYRALLLIKNRDGKPRGTLDLILDGNTFNFIELPKINYGNNGLITNQATIDAIYEKYHY